MLSTISRLRPNLRRPSFRQTLLLATPILVSALYARHPFNVTSTWTHLCGMATQSALSVSDDAKDYGSFKLLQSFPIKYAPVKVAKWRSEKTGLTVVVGDHQAPVTNGHFAIASEIFDDTGRPHTLEHLIFLGSKSYPFKGVLDQLANRAGSDGTNAWTANDHTAYTISTAGSEGFLKMLPIYVDHILHPTITDAGFVTEVHHINGAGEDAGVVYSEMQARENQSGDLMALEMQRKLYPSTSAYRSETGGLMAMLRVLTAEQIREYHGQYYVPHNLCLLVDGAVPIPELFRVLNDEVEPLILQHRPSLSNGTFTPPSDWVRPFVESSTSKSLAISDSTTTVVEFMEEDESMGEVSLNWLGPSPTEYRTNLAVQILGDYLTHSATAPLQKAFVEIPKPYCTGISFHTEDRVNHNELSVTAWDVPTKHLEALGKMLVDKMRAIAQDEGIDMERLGLVLRRSKRKLLEYMETNVSGVLSDVVIADFLYGDSRGKDLPPAFDDLEDYAALEQWSAQDWADLLSKYYVSPPFIGVVGKPSAALSAKLDQAEKDRLAERREKLGEKKLKELEQKLQEAKAESDRPPPEGMITDFPITDPKGLSWVPVETGINNAPGQTISSDRGEVQRHLDQDAAELPFQAHFAHVKSNFVTVSALFDTINVPPHLKPYFSILQTAIFASGVKRADGTILSHEQVVDQLNDFTVVKSAYFTFRNLFTEVMTIELKVEKGDYEKAVGWLRDLITGLVFTQERLQVIVAKQLQELPFEKRDGNKVASAWADRLGYDASKSTSEACSLLNLLEFVPVTAKALEHSPGEVIKMLEQAKAYLLDPSIMRMSVRGDVLSLSNPRSVLAKSFLPVQPSPLAPLSTSAQTKTALGENPSKKMVLVPMPAIEGSYSLHFSKGPTGWDHPDLPALTLAASVLNAAESYLWKSVRGSGLAYGASISVGAESGTVAYSVYRSPNAKLAYEEAKKILTGLADGTVELDRNIVDGARSSLTYKYARASETVMAAAGTAYLNEVLKGVGKDYNQRLLEKFPSITLDEIRSVIQRYLLPIFSSDTAIGAVTVSAGKADEVEAGFKEMGFEVERKELPHLGDAEGSDEDVSMDEDYSDSDGSDGSDGSGARS
ncbi:hypothetical protein JCM24511_08384 [Saitozyma sp. JCM 24511]|nr:hypothetical protein JCM24511_08384 [Saitozyma sp. JCM 24511]